MPILQNKIVIVSLITLAVLIIVVLSFFAFFSSEPINPEVATWNNEVMKLNESVKLKSGILASDKSLGELSFDPGSKSLLVVAYGNSLEEQESNLKKFEETIKTYLQINNDQLCSIFIKAVDRENNNLYLPTCLIIDQE